MNHNPVQKYFGMGTLAAVLALSLCPKPAQAVAGVWRRTAVRTTAVVATEAAVTTTAAASASATASKESAAAQQQQAAAAQKQAAAAQQQAAAAQQQAAAAQQAAAHPQKTPQEKLQDLKKLFDQGLITQTEYDSTKAKILAEMTQ